MDYVSDTNPILMDYLCSPSTHLMNGWARAAAVFLPSSGYEIRISSASIEDIVGCVTRNFLIAAELRASKVSTNEQADA